MAQGLGRLGFAALALEWEKPFFGATVLLVFSYTGEDWRDEDSRPDHCPLPLASREAGRQRQTSSPLHTCERVGRPEIFHGRKGGRGQSLKKGFLEAVEGCQGPWFSVEVTESWDPWAFVKGDTKRVIAALELLATLVAVKLWVPCSDSRQLYSFHEGLHGQQVQRKSRQKKA